MHTMTMSTPLFSEREQAFERYFSHEQEMAFLVRSRRNRLLGDWLGHEFHWPDAAISSYSLSLAEMAAMEGDDTSLLTRVKADCKAAGLELSNNRLARLLDKAQKYAVQALYPQT
jgi:hypothetical protein